MMFTAEDAEDAEKKISPQMNTDAHG